MVAAAFLFHLCWAEEWGYFLHLLGEVECFYSKETRCDERMERRAQSELCLALNLFPVGWAWRREPVDNPDPWGRWGGAKAVVQLFFKPSLWGSSCRGSQLPQALGSATGKWDFFPDFQSEFPVLLLVPVPLAFFLCPAGEGRGLSSLPPSQMGWQQRNHFQPHFIAVLPFSLGLNPQIPMEITGF